MTTSVAQQVYQCDRCGNPDIVAVPIVYQQGTRTFSGILNRGVSQSISAQEVAPPSRRGYLRPVLGWGFGIYLFLFWGGAGISSMTHSVKDPIGSRDAVAFLLLLALVCLPGLILNLRRSIRYNREVYPRLHWDWAHSFMCRRCGKLQLIS